MLGDINLALKLREPKFQICRPDKTIIANLNESYNERFKISLGNINELSFDVPYFYDVNHILTNNPNIKILLHRYIIKMTLGSYIEYFQIQPPSDNMTEDSDYKHIECLSLGIELRDKTIHNLELTSKNATQALTSILSTTNWSIGIVDPSFDLKYRTFPFNSTTVLDAVFQIAEKFDAVPVFNTENREINFMKEDAIGENKGFKINYGRYLQTLNRSYNSNDWITRIKPYGNGELTVAAVNPTGEIYIDDFTFVLGSYEAGVASSEYISDDLAAAILNYQTLLKSKEPVQDIAETGTTDVQLIISLHGLVTGDWILNSDLNEYRKITKIDDNTVSMNSIPGQDSGDIIYKYTTGTFRKLLFEKEEFQNQLTILENDLVTLNDELLIILDNLAVAQENGDPTATLIIQRDNKIAEINNKKIEISNKEAEITAKNSEIATLNNEVAIDNPSNFSSAQLSELNPFIIEQEWINDNYTEAQELYDAAKIELQKRNEPQMIVEANMVNVLQLIEAQYEWDKISVGDTFAIENSKIGVNVEAKLIEADIDFENADINIKIANIKDIRDESQRWRDMFYKSINTTNEVNVKKTTWNSVYTNFSSRNDRNFVALANPIVVNDGTAIDHTINQDGSVDISFEWTFDGSTDAYNIDGFTVFVRSAVTDEPYIFGSNVAKEQLYNIYFNKRAFILYGVPADRYYTFGVQAYRIVDDDINSNGILKSSIMQSTYASENPYQPSSSVAFSGDITGTVDGVAVGTLTTQASNGNTAYSGTAKYRSAGAPTNNPTPATIDVNTNTDGSIDIKVGWSAYTQGTNQADMLLLFWKKGSASGLGSPTVNDACVSFNVNTSSASYFELEGVASDKYYSFGIAAARRTENGLEIGAIQSSALAPDWQDVTRGTPDYLGTVGGVAVDSIETQIGSQDKVDNHNLLESPHNLPSYVKLQSDGLKVFDSLSNKRCHLGYYEHPIGSGIYYYGLIVYGGRIEADVVVTGRYAASGGSINYGLPGSLSPTFDVDITPGGFTTTPVTMAQRGLNSGVSLTYTSATKDTITFSSELQTNVIFSQFGTVATNTRGVAWDGTYLWQTEFNSEFLTNIYKVNTSGTTISSISAPSLGMSGIAWDGTYLWVVSYNYDLIYKLDTSGTVVSQIGSAGTDPAGLDWDGTYLWQADYGNDRIYKLNTSGVVISSFLSPSSSPWGIAWDGTYLWSSDTYTDKIYKLNTSGTVISQFNSPATSPNGLTFDGVYLWNVDDIADKVYKIGDTNDTRYALIAVKHGIG